MKVQVKKYTIDEIYYLENLNQIDALTSNIRYRMISLLASEPRTAAQLGRELGISRPKAHYHLQVLVRLGFAALVEEILVNGIVEKYFVGKARFYSFDRLDEYSEKHPEDKDFSEQLSRVKNKFLTTVLGVTREKIAATGGFRDTSSDFTFDFGAHLASDQVEEIDQALEKIAHRIRLMGEENLKRPNFPTLPYYRSTILFMESSTDSILLKKDIEHLSE